MTLRWRWFACVLLWPFILAGCSRKTTPPPQQGAGDPNVLTVYASCALAPAMEKAGARFQAQHAGKSVRVEAGEPAALAKKIEDGATPDVFVCVGGAETGLLEREGLLDGGFRRSVGSFGLCLATPAGKPQLTASDLPNDSVKSITMPVAGGTSLGTDGKHALERLGVWSKIQTKLLLRQSGAESLQGLAKGEADAAIIYNPCPLLKAEGKVPPDSVIIGKALGGNEKPARVELSIHRSTPRTQLAQQFIALVRSDEMKPDLVAAGILPPAGESAQPEQSAPSPSKEADPQGQAQPASPGG